MTKKKTLSPEQNQAANPQNNVWVQANAGTGKTSVLVQRLLRILFRSPDCGMSGILCLTYTKAGAGEMRNRILHSLREWAVASDDALIDMLDGVAINTPVTKSDVAHAREIFFKYIDRPDMLQIKTIHGFCEEILYRFPIEAGISPAWSLVSDTAQRVLLQDVFERLINSSVVNERVFPAFEHIVSRVSETYMDKLLGVLCEQYKLFFQVDDFDKYREYFIDTTKKYLNIENVPSSEFSVGELKKAITDCQFDEKPTKTLNKIIDTIQQFIDKTIDFEQFKTAFLKKDGQPTKYVSEKDYLSDIQHKVYCIDQYNANKTLFDDTIALFDLSAAFTAEYRRMKQCRNLLDFEDLILYTRKLFSDPAVMGWVLSQLDLSLSHILVDEAQDTSPAQWDILRMLSGDFFATGDTAAQQRSLFVVGDTKQSIYGFQGADPRAFATSRHAIAEHIMQNLRTISEIPLDQSFRSTKPILDSVDKFFDDVEVIELSGFANNKHKCFRESDVGAVEIHALTAKQETNKSLQDYLSDIANKISQLITDGKYKANDIMVLVQRRDPMVAPLTKLLKQQGIPVAGSDRIVLPEYPAVRDMLNLVRWCLNQKDDFSLCCVLKSPFFYLTERDIFDLCKTKQDTKSPSCFHVLKTMHPQIYDFLTMVHQWSLSMAPYTFFTRLLNTNGIRQNFIAALGGQIIDPLEEFLTISLSYERTFPGTLRHFLKWFITGSSEIKRDMNAADGVRIVTVHSSKGLEAPVVFLIDTVRVPRPEIVLPIQDSNNDSVWLWGARSSASAARANAAKDSKFVHMAEYYRLLYVAMTRARDELYIYGYTPDKNPVQDSWHAQLWRVLANDSAYQYIRITNENIA